VKITKKIKRDLKQIRAIIYLQNKYIELFKWYLASYNKFLLVLSPALFLKHRYNSIFNRKINLINPELFSEKLVWLNLYWLHPLKIQCADKYAMRSYVEKQGWGHLLPEILGVYENSSEIDFSLLPEKFVLKCTHGSAFNIICENKSLLDLDDTHYKLNTWMKKDYSKVAGELHYSFMKPLIICEKFLDDFVNELPVDFKVYCFNGKAICTLVALDRNKKGHTEKFDIYNLDWTTKLPYIESSLKTDRFTQKPDAYEEMIEAAEALSKPFPFVRMDFYNIRGKAVLGEMTFTPAGCMYKGYTETAERDLGALITLPTRLPYSSTIS